MSVEKIDRIAWPVSKGFVFTDKTQILYCRANGSYTEVFLKDGANIHISYKLGIVHDMLNSLPFFRVHESCLANLHHVTELRKTDGHIELIINNTPVTVAKSRRKALLEAFHLLNEGEK